MSSRGTGRVHRRLVNEAGDVSEDMEVRRRFHIAAFVCGVDKLLPHSSEQGPPSHSLFNRSFALTSRHTIAQVKVYNWLQGQGLVQWRINTEIYVHSVELYI